MCRARLQLQNGLRSTFVQSVKETRLRRCSTTNCTQAGCGNALLSLGELEGSTARLQEAVAADRRGFRGFRASPTTLAAKICASFYNPCEVRSCACVEPLVKPA